MASTNQSPFYQRAEQEFHEATSDCERIACLEIMMKEVPKHKSSENMRKNLTNRYKKLKNNVEKQKKSGKGGQAGIKKADMQCVVTGFPNVGKSTIFNLLSEKNKSEVSPHQFTTFKPNLGTFKFEDAQIQIIDDAPFPNQDKSLINSTDTLLIIIDSLNQIKESDKYLWKSKAKKIYIYNKIEELNPTELRKLKATLKSKYKNLKTWFINKNSNKIEINLLKKEIFETFPIIRVYTKEPRKQASKDPMILKEKSTFKDAAEKILKGMSSKIKRARVWGPSSKFGGQVIGLEHKLKDKDIIEFQTK